jgi:hypothetical protein
MRTFIAAYSLLLLLTCSTLHAQSSYLIVGAKTTPGLYHRWGLSQDTISTLGTLSFRDQPLDLDMDGLSDCQLSAASIWDMGTTSGGLTIGQISSRLVVDFLWELGSSSRLYAGDTLFATDSTMAFIQFISFAYPPMSVHGDFPLEEDSLYIGLKYESPAGPVLGWMRMASDSITLPGGGMECSVYLRELVLGYTLLGREEVKPERDFTLSPNPASTQLRLQIQQPADWRITDLQGRLLASRSAVQDWALDLADWPSGVYLVECTVAGERVVRKLVVE